MSAVVPEPDAPTHLELAGGFPPATQDEWRALVAAVLARSGLPQGSDPVDALSSTTYDDIRLRPLYTAEDAPAAPPAPATRGVRGGDVAGWDVRQRLADPDATRAAASAVADLEGGATSLWLVVGDAGLPVADLPAALEGVYLDLAPIALDAGADTAAASAALLGVAADRGVAPGELRGALGADPIGLRARTGDDADLGLLAELADRASACPDLRLATVDATTYHDAGAGDAAEVAIATSIGVAYLRALTAAGLSIDRALDAVEFRFAVTAEQFASIAKLRAARRIWARVAELSGAVEDHRRQRQHAVTSAAMLTRRDPWVNILRTTIGCFAAACGGADAITVLPFDDATGLSDGFARRIARNTHAILHDESSLARVADPAGGSWYVESFTEAMASAAWQQFVSIERAGGALRALDDGVVDELVAVARDARTEDVAHRRVAIIGVSEFAFPDEQALAREPAPPRPSGGRLQARRYAEPFEQLRTRADAADPRPAVFLATLGPVAAHSARLGFATNLFQAGGLRVVSGPPEDFADSGTSVVCLCASDKLYAKQAPSAIEKLSDAKLVWLAGKPSDIARVDGYVHTGCDALDVLRTTLDALEVPAYEHS